MQRTFFNKVFELTFKKIHGKFKLNLMKMSINYVNDSNK